MSGASFGCVAWDDFSGSGDGSDNASFAAAIDALQGAGTVFANPAKVYRLAGSPVLLPPGVTLACLSRPGGDITGGAIVIDPGAATTGGLYANALQLSRNCGLSGLRILSAALYDTPPQTLIDMDAFTWGGNGVQMASRADDCTIDHCLIAGFGTGIAQLDTGAGCGTRLAVETLAVDCGTGIAVRNNTDSGHVCNVKAHPISNPSNIGVEANFALGAALDDGAGGCILPIVSYKGAPQPFPPEVGTPTAGGTFRILLLDAHGAVVGSVAPGAPQQDWGPYPTNAFSAVWTQIAGAWAFRLPNIPPASFGNIAGVNGVLAIVPPKGVAGVPALAGVPAMAQRPGPVLDLQDAGEYPAVNLDLQGNLIGVRSVGNTRAEIIGLFMDTSPTTNAGARCVEVDGTSLNIKIHGGHFSQYGIGFLNLAGSGSATLPVPHRLSGIRSSAQLAHIIQAGGGAQLVDWFLGPAAEVIVTPGHAGMCMVGCWHATQPKPVAYSIGTGAAAPVMSGCMNAPAGT